MNPDASVVNAVFNAFRLRARRSAPTRATLEGEPTVSHELIQMRKDNLKVFDTVEREGYHQTFRVNLRKVDGVWGLFQTADGKKDAISIVSAEIADHINRSEKWFNELYIGSELVCKRRPGHTRTDLDYGWWGYANKRRLEAGRSVVVNRIDGAIRKLWPKYESKWSIPIHLTIGLDACLLHDIEKIESFRCQFYQHLTYNADYTLGRPMPLSGEHEYTDVYSIERNEKLISRKEADAVVDEYQENLDETPLIEFMSRFYELDGSTRDHIRYALKTELGKAAPGKRWSIVSTGINGEDDYKILKILNKRIVATPMGRHEEFASWTEDDQKLDGALGQAIQKQFVEMALRNDGKPARVTFECECF